MKLKDLSPGDKIILLTGLVETTESDDREADELNCAKAWFVFNWLSEQYDDVPLYKLNTLFASSSFFDKDDPDYSLEEYLKEQKKLWKREFIVVPITEEMAMSLKDVYFEEFGCRAYEFFSPVSKVVDGKRLYHFGMKYDNDKVLLIDKNWEKVKFKDIVHARTPYYWSYWSVGYPPMYGHMLPPSKKEVKEIKGRIMLRKIDGDNACDPNVVYTEEEKELYDLKPGEYITVMDNEDPEQDDD